MQVAANVATRGERLLQRVKHEIRTHRAGQAPPQYHSVDHVDDERDMDDGGPRRDVDEVGDPELVGTLGLEPALDHRSAGRAALSSGLVMTILRLWRTAQALEAAGMP